MPGIRTFIAIDLPADVRHKLNAVEQQLQARCGEAARQAVRWVPADKIHLTLKFLGDVSSELLPALADLLQGEAARHPAFELVIGGLGVFPNPRRPRVIWVGCDGGAGLGNFQKALDQATQRLGYPGEGRPFSPHLTLGRVSEGAREDELSALVRALQESKIGELGPVSVTRVHLFRSDLRTGGPVYTSLNQFALGITN